MAKVKLIYSGTQQAQGVYEVDEDKVEALIARGDFHYFQEDKVVTAKTDKGKAKQDGNSK